jgi:Gpi18-like mannosyltransferase
LDFRAPEFSAGAFTLGVLTKPQSIALFPLLAYMILKGYGWRKALTSGLVSAFTVLLVILPFRWNNPVDFLAGVYFKGYGYYSYNSINAFNLWALMGFWKPDTQPFPFLNLNILGWAMFGALAVFLIQKLNRRFNVLRDPEILFFAFLMLFGFFMLPTRIHERYLFPTFSVLVLVLPFIGRARWIYGALTFTYLFNQAYVVDFLNRGEFIPDGDIFACTIAVINICVFIYSIYLSLGKGGEPLYPFRFITSRRKAQ